MHFYHIQLDEQRALENYWLDSGILFNALGDRGGSGLSTPPINGIYIVMTHKLLEQDDISYVEHKTGAPLWFTTINRSRAQAAS